jgi:hypothetical protein
VTVDVVSRRIEDGLVLSPTLTGEQLLDAMRATPASEYVVADPPRPVRVLVTSDVAAAVTT